MRLSTALRGILAECLIERDWRSPPPELLRLVAAADLSALPQASTYHGITGYVHHRLKAITGIDQDALAALREGSQRALDSHRRTLVDLARAQQLLDSIGVPWLVVKGPVLAEEVHARAEFRAYGDLDLVVPHQVFPDAVAAFENAGCPVLDQNWRLLRREMRGQVHLTLWQGTPLELHWHLLNRASVRRSFSISMADLFARARRASVRGIPVRTLDTVDTLVHAALHASLHGARRLVWLKDIERLISKDPPAWDEVIARAALWGAAGMIWAVFRKARTVIAAAIPGDVLASLSPPPTQRLVAVLIARLLPLQRPIPTQPVTQMLGRTMRQDYRSVVGSGNRLTELLHAAGLPGAAEVFGSRSSLSAPQGDRREREAFLRSVGTYRGAV